MKDVITSMRCYKEKIFVPVFQLITVETINDAINLINHNPYVNNTALYTTNGSTGYVLLRTLNVHFLFAHIEFAQIEVAHIIIFANGICAH